jgi:hypothetical protein
MQLEYEVSVTGLGEAAIAAERASASAKQADLALKGARSSTSSTLPVLLMGVRSINAARLAVEQTSKALTDLDLRAAMYGFLNMMQVVRNLNSLMIMLRESTGAASAAQAILATLTGRWWLIPLALAAGAIIYAQIRSMQEGGLVGETGLYLLHRGEEVVPSREVVETRRVYTTRNEYLAPRTVQSFGPIFVTFERQPREGPELDRWLRELGPRLVVETRRSG